MRFESCSCPFYLNLCYNIAYQEDEMNPNIGMLNVIIIPFLGTALGAASVFLFKKEIGNKMQRALTGFASGVMVSESLSQ